MDFEISSTEAVRNFGDCLARVKHRGDTFVVTKNKKPIAEIRPVGPARDATVADLLEMWRPDPSDPDFADDLVKANASELPRFDQWDS